ncbi:outer membrane beta-barrel protein [Rhodobacterales bacterium HKCCE3408]|nr:outer membrane beta-barrel protein [Rhodobacterales bacterium HKCCE3408]
MNKVSASLFALCLCVLVTPAAAQVAPAPTAGTQTASVTYGPYVRLEFGGHFLDPDDGFWQSGAGDPQVSFDLARVEAGHGAIAVGFDWQNGFRGELSFMRTGEFGLSGPCSSASDGSSCTGTPHADITGGSFHSTVVMGNVYYAPFEAQGSNSVFQPFIVGGLGVAANRVDSWTRFNPAPPGGGAPTRVFGSNTTTDWAWSIGVGAALQVTRPGQRPVILEASWRHYDLGTAEGGDIANVGASRPVQPLTWENSSEVFSISVRIPLQRL